MLLFYFSSYLRQYDFLQSDQNVRLQDSIEFHRNYFHILFYTIWIGNKFWQNYLKSHIWRNSSVNSEVWINLEQQEFKWTCLATRTRKKSPLWYESLELFHSTLYSIVEQLIRRAHEDLRRRIEELSFDFMTEPTTLAFCFRRFSHPRSLQI